MSAANAPPEDRVLSSAEVTQKTRLSRTTIWRLVRAGGFPPPIQLSANCIGWSQRVVNAWIADGVAAANQRKAA